MKVITPPTIEPVSLENVKAQLGISDDDTTTDAILVRRITAAREWVEGYCERSLINQTLEFRMDNFPSDSIIRVPYPDLVSVTSIKYIEPVAGVETTVDSADYTEDLYDHIIRPVFGETWPSPRSEINAVRVQYVAGFGTSSSDIPDAIIDAVVNIVGHWTNYQSALESGVNLTQIPSAIRKVLDNYRTRWF